MKSSESDIEVSEDERKVMRECVREAFWFRSLPAAAFTGISVNYGIKTGKIKISPRYGGWPIILGASSMAYFVSKLSYIFGKHCTDKFLRDAPDSEIAEQIRKNRLSDEKTWRTEHDEQLNKFSDVLERIDFDTLSDVEKKIINDCNSTAFWQFSVPLMMSASGSIYLAIKKGFLSPSKLSSFPMSPKLIMGASLGYIAGQYLYVYSKECSNRLIQLICRS